MTRFFLALFIYVVIYAEEEEISSSLKSLQMTPYMQLAAGKTLGVNTSYATLGLFTEIPSYTSCTLYSDARFYALLKDSSAFSIEKGVMWCGEKLQLATSVEYHGRFHHSRYFDQVSGGLQFIFCGWELSLDVYYPLKGRKKIHSCEMFFPGNYHVKIQNYDIT